MRLSQCKTKAVIRYEPIASQFDGEARVEDPPTWVHIGALRVQALAAATPVQQDAVVTGADRDAVGLLAQSAARGV